jgi:hypothetical protein
MTTPRRRVLRPPPPPEPANQQRQLQIAKRLAKLEKERAAFDRWMTRLKRAFNAVQKQQRRISRLERQLAGLQTG